jgi:DNA-directed RNA polymerase beta subunit
MICCIGNTSVSLGVACLIALHTCEVDGVECSPYQKTLPELLATAKKLGIAREHRLICGKTGRLLKTPVVSGPLMLQRLRHHAKHKAFACGPIHPVSLRTHRCPGGKKNQGALRYGEGEAIAGGSNMAFNFSRDRLCGAADLTLVPVCRVCGNLADRLTHNRATCRLCPDGGDPVNTEMPWSTVKLVRTLQMMGTTMTFNVEEQ